MPLIYLKSPSGEVRKYDHLPIVIDECDLDLLETYNYGIINMRSATSELDMPYTCRSHRVFSKKLNKNVSRMRRLHTDIAERMGLTGSIDHKDRNRLNNSRDNLREASLLDNNANKSRCAAYENKYAGVTYRPKLITNPWFAGLRRNGKKIHLGSFPTEEEAYAARIQGELDHFGEFAPHLSD